MSYQKETAEKLARAGIPHWNCKHGHSPRGRYSAIYTTLQHIKRRCQNRNTPEFAFYGARGIKICHGWSGSDGPILFKKLVGDRPTKFHSIDRINNDGNYSCGQCDECIENNWPMNCKWSDAQRQANNRRSTKWVNFNGEKMSAADAARKSGIPHPTLLARLRLGWSDFRAITEPVRRCS